MKIEVGDIVTMKKQHPCGEYDWEILRTGIDFRAKCVGCEREIMVARNKFEKNIKKIVKKMT